MMLNGIDRTASGTHSRFLLAWLACAAIAAIPAAHAADAQWKPEKAIQLVANNAPGGGSDRVLRIMAVAMQGFMEVPLTVVNKPGGGGSIAYAYLNQQAGNGHYFLFASKSLITNNIIGRGLSYTEFTPLAHLFAEYIAVTVKLDSPFKNGKDLVEQLKRNPESVTFGIATSLGNPNHQGVAVALKEAGVDLRKLRTVIFPSGGAASTAMMGGHVDVVPLSVAYSADLLRNRQVRLLAVAAPTRMTGVLAEVPTWREQGFDAVVSNWRGIVGPRDMSPAQITFWEQSFQRLTDSPEWKKELDNNFWISLYMGSAELRRFLDRDNIETRAFLVDIGLAK